MILEAIGTLLKNAVLLIFCALVAFWLMDWVTFTPVKWSAAALLITAFMPGDCYGSEN